MPRRVLHVSDSLSLPLDLLSCSQVVYGSSGSGKTVYGKVMAEEAHKAGVRFCIIDIKGDYYGLKSTPDGKGEGIPAVIVGGDHAELPLATDKDKLIQQASFLADLVAGSEASFILDLEHLSKTKQIAFLGPFFERLYDANRAPLLLIMDEAQRYAPEKPSSPAAYECLGAVEDIVKLGRKHGIGRMLLTQRGASLSKETSEICDFFTAFRTPGTLDQKRAREWFGANTSKELADEALRVMSGLSTGEAIFASNHPDLRKGREPLLHFGQVRPSETFDSSATPRIGKRKLEPKKLAKADLEAITEKMSEYIEEAERNDPKKLQVLVQQLERQAASKDRVIAEHQRHIGRLEDEIFEKDKLIEQFEQPLIEMHQVIPVGLPEEIEKLIASTLDLRDGVRNSAEGLDRRAAALQRHLDDLVQTGAVIEELEKPKPASDRIKHERAARGGPTRSGVVVKGGKAPPNPPPPATGRPAPPPPPPGSDGSRPTKDGEAIKLGGRETKLLKVLAAADSVYPQGLTFKQLAFFSKYSPASSSIDAGLSPLRQGGLVEYGWPCRITELGIEFVAGDYDPLPRGPELLAYWRSKLGKRERTFLDVLVKQYPNGVTKQIMADLTDYSLDSSSIDAGMSVLRKMGIADGWRLNDDFWGTIQ